MIKHCGNCRSWKREKGGSDLGNCSFVAIIPDSIPNHHLGTRLGMYESMGVNCPAWEECPIEEDCRTSEELRKL